MGDNWTGATELPAWLTERMDYVPPTDKDSFLQRNILSLASALTVLREEPPSEEGAEKIFAGVLGGARLLGTLALILCVSLASNAAFVWVMLAAWLVRVAVSPARSLRVLLAPPLAAALFALLVNLPALWMGQSVVPVRMASKALVTVGLATNLAHALGAQGLLAALRWLHLPAALVMTVDLAIRDIVSLGQGASTLSEALALRSVGRDRQKTASAAGVMGMTFLRAQRSAAARAEAMELRGYGPDSVVHEGILHASGKDAAYAAVLLLVLALFAYLEVSMP